MQISQSLAHEVHGDSLNLQPCQARLRLLPGIPAPTTCTVTGQVDGGFPRMKE